MIFASPIAMIISMWKIHLHVRMSQVSVKCVSNTQMETVVRNAKTGITEMPLKEKIAKVLKANQYFVV